MEVLSSLDDPDAAPRAGRDDQRMPVRTALLATALAAVHPTALRARMLNWGATEDERVVPPPGDDLIRGGSGGATMATTIDAPPADVWPWLVQMGCDRAGFFSWDRLDNAGRPSAERIHPAWQDVAEGSRVLCVPDSHVIARSRVA